MIILEVGYTSQLEVLTFHLQVNLKSIYENYVRDSWGQQIDQIKIN